MEHTLKGSYAAILVGNLIADNELYESLVRRQLRGNSFKEIIGVLEKYHTFMNLTSSVSFKMIFLILYPQLSANLNLNR